MSGGSPVHDNFHYFKRSVSFDPKSLEVGGSIDPLLHACGLDLEGIIWLLKFVGKGMCEAAKGLADSRGRQLGMLAFEHI